MRTSQPPSNPPDPRAFSAAGAAALLAGATRRRVSLPGRDVEIALIEWPCEADAGAPLALLHHANGFCAATWARFVTHLRPHYRVVALDARGHGDSTSPPPGDAYAWIEFVGDLTVLAERLIEEQSGARRGAPIGLGAGNSFGGLVTAYVAALRPELFDRIAMLDPVLRPPPQFVEAMLASFREASGAPKDGSPDAPIDATAFASRGNPMSIAARKRRQVWPSREAAFDAWRSKPMFSGWAPLVLDLYVAEGLRDRADGQVELKCRREVEASVFDAATGVLDLYEVADRIQVPTLLVRAGRGNFPMQVFEALAARLAAVKLVELDIDHLMPMHDPPELAEVVLDFVR